MEPRAFLEALEAADLEDLFQRLYVYTRGRLRKMIWQGQSGELPPGGMDVEDFIYNALDKALAQVRKVKDPENFDPYSFLCGIISSDINHLSEKLENKSVRGFRPVASDELAASRLDRAEANRSSWPDFMIFFEAERRDFLALFEGNYIDCAVVMLYIDSEQPLSAQEVADLLGLPVAAVYKARERIKARLRARGD